MSISILRIVSSRFCHDASPTSHLSAPGRASRLHGYTCRIGCESRVCTFPQSFDVYITITHLYRNRYQVQHRQPPYRSQQLYPLRGFNNLGSAQHNCRSGQPINLLLRRSNPQRPFNTPHHNAHGSTRPSLQAAWLQIRSQLLRRGLLRLHHQRHRAVDELRSRRDFGRIHAGVGESGQLPGSHHGRI